MAKSTFINRILEHAEVQPEAAAIDSTTAAPTSYKNLAQQLVRHQEQLFNYGLSQHQTAALVLPNGPLAASAFLSVSTSTACAPLNPRYREEEFIFYLDDLGADALITFKGFDSEARNAAARLRIPILEIFIPSGATSGEFSFQGIPDRKGTSTSLDSSAPALLLHTSGTTSRPKLVPLSHQNLLNSADNIAATLQLGSKDICLNIMPLFHVHGLIGAVLSSLAAGAAVCCTPGFIAPRFLQWFAEFKPTWWTAVPTMHQAILDRTGVEDMSLQNNRLRFIRSCSASLPPVVLEALEEVFGVPVIEAYGMTEAAHQISINPLPPLVHKPGSVGLPGETEVAVVDHTGAFLPNGEKGEVVLRGSNITGGYVKNPTANAAAFLGEWFRTGDEGYLDKDGYLFLTGRLKEMINRGGEKIAPREVDEALLAHPDVDQALCFALPHDRLGEEVAAVVVLKENASVSEMEIRAFIARSLSDFKVPARILFREKIPKGPTGKPQRIGLADRLGLNMAADENAKNSQLQGPGSETEKKLLLLWKEVLNRDPIGIQDPFTSLGGDSITALILVARVRDEFGIELSLIDFFDAATIQEQAALITNPLNDTDFSS